MLKISQNDPAGATGLLDSGLQTLDKDLKTQEQQPQQGIQPGLSTPATMDQISKGFTPDQIVDARKITESNMATRLESDIAKLPNGDKMLIQLKALPKYKQLQQRILPPSQTQTIEEQKHIQGLANRMEGSPEFKAIEQEIRHNMESVSLEMQKVDKLNAPIQQQRQNVVRSFNLKNYKKAQYNVRAEEDFISKYLDSLISFQGDGSQFDAISNQAKNEVILMCGPASQEEVNDPLKKIQNLDPNVGKAEAESILKGIYQNWVAPKSTNQGQSLGLKTMSQNPKGIIKYDLSQHVLNNKTATIKTADQHFGTPYILYGPTEKRICPKLRGKNMGDVVSEETCRNHCLDGIVIDDNKTICGEALWRANNMDKFSRDYVDEDGNIKGGYIEKRFEVHHDVPEENKMRLKPGELRKPRPPEWGNTESRMQAMRQAKEGKKRDYRPDTNTGDAFDWSKDQDQNNIDQTQSARDKREENSGHKTIQYTDKTKQENKPKTVQHVNLPYEGAIDQFASKKFNLKQFKLAQSKPRIKLVNPSYNQGTPPAQGGRGGQYEIIDDGKSWDFSKKRPPCEVCGGPIGIYQGKIKCQDCGHMTFEDSHAPRRQGFLSHPSQTQNSDQTAYEGAIDQFASLTNKHFNLKKYKIAQMEGHNLTQKPMPFGDLSYDGLSDGEEMAMDDDLLQSDVVFENWSGPFYLEGKEIASNIQELAHWKETSNYIPDIYLVAEGRNPHQTTWDKVLKAAKPMGANVGPVADGKPIEPVDQKIRPPQNPMQTAFAKSECSNCSRKESKGTMFNLKQAKKEKDTYTNKQYKINPWKASSTTSSELEDFVKDKSKDLKKK